MVCFSNPEVPHHFIAALYKEKGRPHGRPKHCYLALLRLEIEPDRQLRDAVTACVTRRGLNLSEGASAQQGITSGA